MARPAADYSLALIFYFDDFDGSAGFGDLEVPVNQATLGVVLPNIAGAGIEEPKGALSTGELNFTEVSLTARGRSPLCVRARL